MSQNPLRHWIVVMVCCVLAMVLAWRAAHLSTKVVDDATTPQTATHVADASASDATQGGDEQAPADDTQAVAVDDSLAEGLDVSEDAYVDDVDETPAFVMPEGAEYEPDVTLISLADGVTVEQVNAMLTEIDAIATKEVSEEEVDNGYILVEIAEGYTVEDAVNAVLGAEPVEAAQPNYVYHALAGDVNDLQELLDDALDPEIEALESPQGEDVAAGASEEATGSLDDPAGSADADGDIAETPEGEPTEGTSDAQTEGASDDSMVADEESLPADSDNQAEDAELTDESSSDAEDPEATDEGEPSTLQEQLDVNDPYSSSNSSKQWALSSIKAYGAWSVARCEGSVTVAVLDQLPDATHEDLAANVVATYDAHKGSGTLSVPADHGTHVAGIIAGVAQNGKGVAGVSYNANLVLVNVFKSNMASSTTDLLSAYSYIKEQASNLNIRIINLSVGAPIAAYDQRLIDAINDAFTNYGIITVAASGNSPYTMKVNGVITTYTAPYQQYPSDAENVVSVINLRKSGSSVAINSDSNYNLPGETSKNISAPGANIWSTAPNNRYVSMTGTSMAAPHVAGVLALEFAANPNLTAAEAVSILYATATDIGAEGWDEKYGYGEIDALAAVSAANPFLGAEVSVSPASFSYTGSPRIPDVAVRLDGSDLVEGTDYSVVYANNENAGVGTVTITGVGAYKGFASATFQITQAQLPEASVTLSATTLPYTGKAHKPSVTVKVGETTLVQGSDYSVAYKNNVAVGTATVTITGMGNYAGTVTKNFSIVLPDLAEATIDAIPAQKYTGFALTPYPTVRMGSKVLTLNHDYTVAFQNNINAGTATITIKGKIGYSGTRTVKFSIKKVSGVWKKSGSRWWYRWSDGTWPESQFVKIDGKTYWFDDLGWMATGWQKIGGAWYYLASSGAMMTGWQKVGGVWYWLDRTSGKMATGWQKINGAWYYLASSGAMTTGWQKVDGEWYWLDQTSGKMATGWKKIGGVWYWLDRTSGKMVTGWLKIGEVWYWFTPSGAMATGWQKVGSDWYYFASSGAMVANRWVGDYYLKSNGVMATNEWVDGGKYYVDASGKWVKDKTR